MVAFTDDNGIWAWEWGSHLSVLAIGVRSGTCVATTSFRLKSFAHHGMPLKCATGSAMGWLCSDFGLLIFEDEYLFSFFTL